MSATVVACDSENAARPLCKELVAAIGHSAASPDLQGVCRDAMVKWCIADEERQHQSSVVLCSLLWAVSRNVFQLHHRTMLINSLVYAILSTHGVRIHWAKIVSLLSFPSTNPAPLITQSCQDGELLTAYSYMQWRRSQTDDHAKERNVGTSIQSNYSNPRLSDKIRGGSAFADGELAVILHILLDGLATATPRAESEKGFLLLLSEVLDIVCEMVLDKAYISSWQGCEKLVSLLTVWEEDRHSTGILGAIGLGPRSSVSVR